MRHKILIISLVCLFILCCSSPESTELDSVIVYITETGSKYHKGNCGYLHSSKIAITLSEACAKGYTPCSRCDPPKCK